MCKKVCATFCRHILFISERVIVNVGRCVFLNRNLTEVFAQTNPCALLKVLFMKYYRFIRINKYNAIIRMNRVADERIKSRAFRNLSTCIILMHTCIYRHQIRKRVQQQ